MRRRDVLKTFGAAAGAAGMSRFLPGCGGGDDEEEGITTIVLLMMENRSYDHLLGARSWLEGKPGDGLADGMTNPDLQGAPIGLWEAVQDELCVPDPPHGWPASHLQWNGGLNDGFITTHQEEHAGDIGAMQYLNRVHQPVTWALADAYASCDRWFASVMGPTWPNRFYWLAGTSMGMQENDLPPGGFTAPTIFHRLTDKGLDWRIYYADLPFIALLDGGAGIPLEDHGFRLDDFFEDAARGELPPVCFLDPAFTIADDHPPHHPILGQEYIASVYNALATSPQWKNCLLLITYDEHGGFFDHVSPPTTVDERAAEGFDQLGFRVPTLAIGPYVKSGHVSSVVRDHTSALRHIETMFGTEPLTERVSAANDLTELLDLDRLEAGDPAPPIELPSFDVGEWPMEELCSMSTLKPGELDLVRYADTNPAWAAKWDRRHERARIIEAIRRRARR